MFPLDFRSVNSVAYWWFRIWRQVSCWTPGGQTTRNLPRFASGYWAHLGQDGSHGAKVVAIARTVFIVFSRISVNVDRPWTLRSAFWVAAIICTSCGAHYWQRPATVCFGSWRHDMERHINWYRGFSSPISTFRSCVKTCFIYCLIFWCCCLICLVSLQYLRSDILLFTPFHMNLVE